MTDLLSKIELPADKKGRVEFLTTLFSSSKVMEEALFGQHECFPDAADCAQYRAD